MQVSISCDDGFQSKLYISNNINGQDLFHEVCNLRRSLGQDHPEDPTPGFFTIGYSIYGRTIEYITSLVVLDQVLPAVNTPAASSSNSKTQKTPPIVFHIFGFASLKRNNVLLQLREFSSKLAVMSMSFSTAVEHYQRSQLSPPALLPAASSSSSSQALVPYASNGEGVTYVSIDDISNKIGSFFAEIHQLFDLALNAGENSMSVGQKSILTKARGKSECYAFNVEVFY